MANPDAKNVIGTSEMLICRNTRGNLLADQGRYNEAINLFREVLADTSLSNKERNRSKSNLGYTLWLQDNENPEAIEILRETLKLREELKDDQGLIASHIQLTKYFKDSDKELALNHARSALIYAQNTNSLYGQEEALGHIIDIEGSTIKEGKLYKKVDVKLEELRQNTRDIYRVTRFDNDQLKEENFELEVDNANKKSKIILFSALLILLIVLSGFSYFLLKHKHKRDKVKAVIQQTHHTETQLSKKVHDEYANDMAGILHFVDQHPEIPKTTKGTLSHKLEHLYERLRDTATEIAGFDTSQFTQSLSFLITQYHTPGITIITNVNSGIDWSGLPEHKKTNVYRCLQELLVNMKKHSEATRVTMMFKKEGNTYHIQYRDNGKGVDLQHLKKNGLYNMETRMLDIGGSVTFDSSKSQGFKANLTT